MLRIFYFLFALALLMSVSLVSQESTKANGPEDFTIPNGHFYSQTVDGEEGFTVVDNEEALFWSEFQRLGGLQTVGYPISRRYVYDGFVTQAFQKLILQWRVGAGRAWPVNVFDELSDNGFNDQLFSMRQTPYPLTDFDAPNASWQEIIAARQGLLDANPAIRDRYFSFSNPLNVFGLPTSRVEDMGNHYAVRTQRAVFQQWKEEVPWASKGQVTIANGGDIAKEMGWLSGSALEPQPVPETTQDLERFTNELKQAVVAKNDTQLVPKMDNPFGVGFWLSEGRSFPPNGALNFLSQQYLTTNNIITFPEPQPDITALLGGFDPQNLVAPDTNIAQILFSKGWGRDGQAEALLFVTQKADGAYVWHSVIIAHYRFDLSGHSSAPTEEQLLTMPESATIRLTSATATTEQESNCLFFTETVQDGGGFSVCDDQEARFRAAFERWGLQKIGYPISRRYNRDGFVTQAFQKAIMQWRPDGNYVALVNIFDDLHNGGFDDVLVRDIQTPRQFPAGWDGDIPFNEVVIKRQALLNVRPALRETYFASSDPLTFYGLPTSEVEDVGNHYAIRLQRAVLQEWKEEVPWASAGQVTIANGGDIAKRFGALPDLALIPESEGNEGGAGSGSLPSLATASFEVSSVRLMKWANNGTLAIATENSVLLYDTNALNSGARQLPGEMENIMSLAISPDNLWLAAGLENGQILLWSLANNDSPTILADHTESVAALTFTPNSTQLLSGGGMNDFRTALPYKDTDVRVWDVKSGSKIRQLSHAKGRITTLAMSADGTTVMAGTNDVDGRRFTSCDGSIQYWDFESGAPLSTHQVGHPIWFNTDGQMGIARECQDSSMTVQLWETSSRTIVREFDADTPVPVKFPYNPTLSQNGATLVTGIGRIRSPNEQLFVWDVATGAELFVSPSDTSTTALNPNGNLLAIGNGRGEHDVHLWRVGASNPLAVVGQHNQSARHMAFSPDGNWLVSATFGGTLVFANVESVSDE